MRSSKKKFTRHPLKKVTKIESFTMVYHDTVPQGTHDAFRKWADDLKDAIEASKTTLERYPQDAPEIQRFYKRSKRKEEVRDRRPMRPRLQHRSPRHAQTAMNKKYRRIPTTLDFKEVDQTVIQVDRGEGQMPHKFLFTPHGPQAPQGV